MCGSMIDIHLCRLRLGEEKKEKLEMWVNADIQSAAVEIRRRKKEERTRMWANAQPDGRPAEHRWRPLFNAAKFA